MISIRRNSMVNHRRESYCDVRRESVLVVPSSNGTVETNADVFKTPESINLLKGFCLSITYGACIGGTGSLIGTVPNLIFKEHFDQVRPDDGMSFVTFMAFSLPLSILMTLVAWIVIGVIWLPRGFIIYFKDF
jgi:di/tricarboxylate transporter